MTQLNKALRLLRGEVFIGLHPALDAPFRTLWTQRMRAYAGRALTEIVLDAEQVHAMGHLNLNGHTISHGISRGLEVSMLGTPESPRIYITAGDAVSANGEDVILPRAVEVSLWDVPIWRGQQPLGEDGQRPSPYVFDDGLNDDNTRSTRADVLVLQPIVASFDDDMDPNNPCEYDPNDAAFEDRVLEDGVRLIRVPWPDDLPMPAPSPRWRNALSYALFEAESVLSLPDVMSWCALGVPVGLVAWSPDHAPFVDHHSVARRQRAVFEQPLGGTGGSVGLWEARFEQWVDQLFGPQMPMYFDQPLSTHFNMLPPVGMLPVDALTVRAVDELPMDSVFPPNYHLRASPIRLEDLGDALMSSASLAPFDLSVAEQVDILVPVPDAFFDPMLLQRPAVSDEFHQAVYRFRERLYVLRTQRDGWYGDSFTKLYRSLTGQAPPVPDDPGQLASEESEPTASVEYGVQPYTDAQRAAYRVNFGAFGGDLSARCDTEVAKLAQRLDDVLRLSASEVLTFEQLPDLTSFTTTLRDVGLDALISMLEASIRRSDDVVDMHFLHVQADVERVRKIMSGQFAQTQLATSPVTAFLTQFEAATPKKAAFEEFVQLMNDGGATVNYTAQGITPQVLDPAGGLSRFAVTPADATPTLIDEAPQFRLFSDGLDADAVDVRFRPALGMGLVQLAQASVDAYQPLDFGEATLNDRIDESPAVVAFRQMLHTKSAVFETVRTIHHEYGIDLRGIAFPGFLVSSSRTTKIIGEITETVVADLASGEYDDLTGTDEASFYNATILGLEDCFKVLRLLAGRIARLKKARDTLLQTRKVLESMVVHLAPQWTLIRNALVEARHDVQVANALLAEEQARVAVLDQRRQAIMDEHVPYLVFRRPLTTQAAQDAPSQVVEPMRTQAAVPACLREQMLPGPEVRRMLAMLRHAPVSWFPTVAEALAQIKEREALLTMLHQSTMRSKASQVAEEQVMVAGEAGVKKGLEEVMSRQHRVLMNMVEARKGTQIEQTVAMTWRATLDKVRRQVTLGDVVDPANGRPNLSRQVVEMLEQMGSVAACLTARLRDVPVLARLRWAQAYGQYDAPASLHDLHVLPDWQMLEKRQREDMQEMVDWLFDRVDDSRNEALAWVSSLVRVCLLLASHAPVDRVVVAQVIQTRPARVGDLMRVEYQMQEHVRVGMHVALLDANQVIAARGVIDDTSQGGAVIRVMTSHDATTTITTAHIAPTTTQVTAVGQMIEVGMAGSL